MEKQRFVTRRDLLKCSAATAGVLALPGSVARMAWGSVTDTIRVGLIGCGGRGTGAARDCLKAAQGVQIVALADAFKRQTDAVKGEFKVADGRCFAGLDAYKQLLALDDVDLVILATPPGFRPLHFSEAIARGKHVFMEKPVAVCPTGIDLVMETGKLAAQKKLGVVAGTQRRHQASYIETMKRIHDGQIGEIVAAQCYWNMGGLWVRAREAGESDVEWQIRNWLYFRWLSGDHIVEQHVHNIDVINWAVGALPDTIHSVGGRQYRKGPEFGNIYDHFGTEFTYPKDVRTISMCRQIDGAADRVSERVVGTKGSSNCCGVIEGEKPWRFEGTEPNPYVQEHADLIASIRAGQPLNEAQTVAESTLCAIMARESAYTWQQFKRAWFEERCTLDLTPPAGLKLSDSLPVAPVPVPGQYVLAGLGQSEGQGRRKNRK
jgi:predicted dehydrogenase